MRVLWTCYDDLSVDHEKVAGESNGSTVIAPTEQTTVSAARQLGGSRGRGLLLSVHLLYRASESSPSLLVGKQV